MFDHDIDTLVHDAFTMHAIDESDDRNINMEDALLECIDLTSHS